LVDLHVDSFLRVQPTVLLSMPLLCFCTARRYGSALYAVVACPPVRPSVRHKPVLYRNDWTKRVGFWHEGFLPPTPHRVIRKFGYLQKLGYFPLGLCPKLLKSSSTVEFVDDTYTTVDESWLFTTSRSTVTASLRSVVERHYGLNLRSKFRQTLAYFPVY